jgi:hypothetical protein
MAWRLTVIFNDLGIRLSLRPRTGALRNRREQILNALPDLRRAAFMPLHRTLQTARQSGLKPALRW